jgi:hypothetical protein
VLGVGRQQKLIARGERAGGYHVGVRQNLQRPVLLVTGGWLIAVGQAERVAAQGGEPDRLQAVVAAQRIQILPAPVVLEVLPPADGMDVVEVEQSQRAGVFEQHRQRVAALQDFPCVEAVIAQTAVLGSTRYSFHSAIWLRAIAGLMFRRRMVANRVSTPSHSPGGQPANAAATAWRRGLAALRTLRARWPLISSIQLNSSIPRGPPSAATTLG